VASDLGGFPPETSPARSLYTSRLLGTDPAACAATLPDGREEGHVILRLLFFWYLDEH
jgi:hypothetical protein